MHNDAISQEISCTGWEVFLDEAKKRFADAADSRERKNWRQAIRAFQLLIRAKAPMPQKGQQHGD